MRCPTCFWVFRSHLMASPFAFPKKQTLHIGCSRPRHIIHVFGSEDSSYGHGFDDTESRAARNVRNLQIVTGCLQLLLLDCKTKRPANTRIKVPSTRIGISRSWPQCPCDKSRQLCERQSLSSLPQAIVLVQLSSPLSDGVGRADQSAQHQTSRVATYVIWSKLSQAD